LIEITPHFLRNCSQLFIGFLKVFVCPLEVLSYITHDVQYNPDGQVTYSTQLISERFQNDIKLKLSVGYLY